MSQILLLVEDDGFCLNFPVLNARSVATQHAGLWMLNDRDSCVNFREAFQYYFS